MGMTEHISKQFEADLDTTRTRRLLQFRTTDRGATRQRPAPQRRDIQQDTAGRDRTHAVDAAMRRAGGAARAGSREPVVELIVVPGVAQGIDMRADMQRHDHRVTQR